MGIRVQDSRPFWRLMDPAERWRLMSLEEKAIFPELAPAEEKEKLTGEKARGQKGDEELEHQKKLCGWLEQNDWAYWYSGTHKKTSTKVGTPDFCLGYRNRILALEIKGPGGVLSPAQRTFAAALAAKGVQLQISRSFTQSISLITSWTAAIDKELAISDISQGT